MTPTLWQAVHDREHHQNTNDLRDPDRAYLEAQPDLAVTPRRELWGELVDPKWMRYR
jgi:fatty acid desaturase